MSKKLARALDWLQLHYGLIQFSIQIGEFFTPLSSLSTLMQEVKVRASLCSLPVRASETSEHAHLLNATDRADVITTLHPTPIGWPPLKIHNSSRNQSHKP